MKAPKKLKQALENGYIINKLYAKESKRIRVDLKERYHVSDRQMFLSFWIDRDYFKRNYPNAYERL